ncbi:LacI family DNA-binding transcriptional regulator [Fontivita pretiosa]|uniref:LacI family DNA-binding transcriptional regulator n=1 Tax=Fontivita pretiosa TaxID=2989684 RepID=UPI003D16C146
MSISKVAKLAGVSSSTVSRVINNHPRVAPETAQSVRQAMKQLGYVPSDRRPGPKPASRSRIGTGNIAFLVLGTSGDRATPAFEDLLRGVSLGASQNELNLSFSHVSDVEHLPQRLLDRRIDGVLLHGVIPSGELRRQLMRVPTVWLMGNRRRPDWGDQVMPDGYEIGDLAARYLLERGHRRLAFLNLDAGHWVFKLYYQSFASRAADDGASVALVDQMPPESADYWQKYTAESVESLIRRFLSLDPRPTGLFVADDMQVALIQPALQHRGIRIGAGQTEIVSCNNEKPYLVGLSPRPTVIDIRVESIGRRGVEQLMWRIEHPDVPERIIATIEPFIVKADAPHPAGAPAATVTA